MSILPNRHHWKHTARENLAWARAAFYVSLLHILSANNNMSETANAKTLHLGT